jgi:hypothetical protein
MKKLAIAVAVIALIGTPALAADIAVKAPPAPPWLFAPAPMAVADTATILADGTQSPSQPPEEDLLNLED